VAVYRERGILLQVDGAGDVAEVSERILSALRD
jgi:adenylate kinase family enzyme